MLYHLLVPLSETGGLFKVFNVFRYVSFRTAWALITCLGFCYVLYPYFIRWMQRKKMEQIIRTDGPESHRLNKAGTPTMGGVPMREIDPSTMESRVVQGLHLAGEILDIDGRIGGFNFQWAWASGFTAGRACGAP